MDKLFYCYSYKLKLFLKDKGIKYKFTGNNLNNDKPYWGYLKDDLLEMSLKEY
jgi:hypothetical protein